MVLDLHMINVNGDATLIQVIEGRKNLYNILIDGGRNKYNTANFLLENKINQIDLIVISHIDCDHIFGLKEVINNPNIKIKEIWVSNIRLFYNFLKYGVLDKPNLEYVIFCLITAADIIKKAANRNIEYMSVYDGDKISFGNLQIEVIYPPRNIEVFLKSKEALAKVLKSRKIPNDGFPSEIDIKDPSSREKYITERLKSLSKKTTFKPFNDKEISYLNKFDIPFDDSDFFESDYEEEETYFVSETLINDTSIVLRLIYRNKRLLFPGDLTNWYYILKNKLDIIRNTDIFKVPHHGSDTINLGEEKFRKKLIEEITEFLWKREQDITKLSKSTYYEQIERMRCDSLIFRIVNPKTCLMFPYNRLPTTRVRRVIENINAKTYCLKKKKLKEPIFEDKYCCKSYLCEKEKKSKTIECGRKWFFE